ncbi:MAG TPA: MotA/TolQ/ExbB proton channel family protein [Candidatus Competibacteraceae bacterium]|mgnify:CR=1 FL=1|nr:MotA/TolQ/ExbB proton channel family protein [Candidatus Competibacteraceae bacterium]HRY18564.1 MotA/TolQ/ExbB proton channel family protein [Candidatus Competibacteraceae bacterium]
MENLTFFGQMIENLLWNAQAKTVTEVFLLLVLIGFSVAVWLTRKDRAPRFVSYAPTLLTSLGILGTFVGIVVGLMHFKPDDIDASIPALLEGLKTAFITSLAGMGSAILFKVLTTTLLIAPPRKQNVVSGTGPEEILGALLEQNQMLKGLKTAISGAEETSLAGQMKLSRADQNDQHKEMIKAVTELRVVVSGMEEISLAGQLKLLCSDENDRHKETMLTIAEDRDTRNQFANKLWQELDEFAEMLSKSATEQMINALREVIADFNKNLTEQFGDNFKALDASVQKLAEWQDNYRQQLKQMSAQYEQAVRAITQIEASVVHIAKEAQQIPTTMAQLKTVLEVNQHQLQELSRHLEIFRDMRDKAVEAVPQIREQIEQTVNAIAASVQTASEHYTKLLDLSDAYIEAHDEKTHKQLDTFIKTTDQGINRVREGLENGATVVENALMQGAQKLDDGVHDLQSHLTKTADCLVAQNETLHKQLEGAFIQIHEHAKDMANNLSEHAKGLSKTLKTAGEQAQRDTRATQEQVAESIIQMQKRLESTLEEVSTAQMRTVNRTVDSVLEEMSKAVSKTGEGVNKQLSAIDQAMQQEINRVMNEMGQALAQITGQFTGDYIKLVHAMQQVVTEQGQSARQQAVAKPGWTAR